MAFYKISKNDNDKLSIQFEIIDKERILVDKDFENYDKILDTISQEESGNLSIEESEKKIFSLFNLNETRTLIPHDNHIFDYIESLNLVDSDDILMFEYGDDRHFYEKPKIELLVQKICRESNTVSGRVISDDNVYSTFEIDKMHRVIVATRDMERGISSDSPIMRVLPHRLNSREEVIDYVETELGKYGKAELNFDYDNLSRHEYAFTVINDSFIFGSDAHTYEIDSMKNIYLPIDFPLIEEFKTESEMMNYSQVMVDKRKKVLMCFDYQGKFYKIILEFVHWEYETIRGTILNTNSRRSSSSVPFKVQEMKDVYATLL